MAVKLFLALLPALCFLSPCREASAHSTKLVAKKAELRACVVASKTAPEGAQVAREEIFFTTALPGQPSVSAGFPATPALPPPAKHFAIRTGLSPPRART